MKTTKYVTVFVSGFLLSYFLQQFMAPGKESVKGAADKAATEVPELGGQISVVEKWGDGLVRLSEASDTQDRMIIEAELIEDLGTLSIDEKIAAIREGYEYPDQNSVRKLMWELARELGRDHPNGALQVFRELSIAQRKEFMKPMIQGVAMANAEAALDWIMSVGETDEGRFIDRKARNQLMYAALLSVSRMKGEPVRALEMAIAYPDPEFRQFLAGQTAQWIVDGSPEDAIEGLDLGAASDKYILEAVMEKWAGASPSSAQEWIIKHRGGVSNDTVRTVASNVASQIGPDALESLYMSVPDEYQKSIIGQIAARWEAKTDLVAAVEWLSRVSDPHLYSRAARGVLYELGAEAPLEKHVQFVEAAFEEGSSERRDLIRETMEKFEIEHPEQVDAYLERLIAENREMLVE